MVTRKLLASRNVREGHYSSGDGLVPKEFNRERKRGRKSRRIISNFFNNGDRYDTNNSDNDVAKVDFNAGAFAQQTLGDSVAAGLQPETTKQFYFRVDV